MGIDAKYAAMPICIVGTFFIESALAWLHVALLHAVADVPLVYISAKDDQLQTIAAQLFALCAAGVVSMQRKSAFTCLFSAVRRFSLLELRD